VYHQLFLAFPDDFVAFDHSLLAGAAVLAFLPPGDDIAHAALGPLAETLEDCEPRYAREKAQTRSERKHQHERSPGVPERDRNPLPHDGAEEATGLVRQGRRDAV
jgi:hypothetical protein